MTHGRVAVLAVDGGNSKADVALVSRDGGLIAAVRGPTVSHQAPEFDLSRPASVRARLGMQRLATLATDALGRRGGRDASESLAQVAVLCVAGADFAGEIRMLRAAARDARLAREVIVLNDSFAPLRAGTTSGWGIALICGAGVNAAGIGPDGRRLSFPAVGEISGDWGGGMSVGMAGLAAAVRARDGRGRRTALERAVPAHFGFRRPSAVTQALYDGRIPTAAVRGLSPVVFATARAGDEVARGIVDALADELATMAIAIGRRLHIVRREVEVVLAGGVFRSDDPAFRARLEAGILAVMPHARLVRLHAPPVLGATLLGLDSLPIRGRRAAEARLRAALTGSAIRSI